MLKKELLSIVMVNAPKAVTAVCCAPMGDSRRKERERARAFTALCSGVLLAGGAD